MDDWSADDSDVKSTELNTSAINLPKEILSTPALRSFINLLYVAPRCADMDSFQLLKSEVGRVCRPFGRSSSNYDSGRMGQSYEALHVECPLRLGALDGLPAKSGREGIKHLG